MGKVKKYRTEEERREAARASMRRFRERQRARMEADPEYREKVAAQRRANWRKYSPKWRERKNAYMRDYYRRNSEHCKEYSAEYRRRKSRESAEYRAVINAGSKRWRTKNKAYDMLRKTVAAWARSGDASLTDARLERFDSLFAECTELQKLRAHAMLAKYGISSKSVNR